MEHWQYDAFVARWRGRTLRADAFITSSLDTDGNVESGRMKPASSAVDFSYDFQDLRLKQVGR